MKIYIDIFLFLNFSIDFICLYTTEKVLSLPLSLSKLILGAAIGGVWAVVFLFFPSLHFLHIPVATLLTFTVTGRKKVLGGTLLFILSEALMGGLVISVSSLLSFLPKYGIRFGAVIFLSVLLVLTSEKIYEAIIRKKLLTSSVTATVSHNNKKKKVCLMIDSGNLAREATTGRRIIFIKEKSITDLTGEITDFFECQKIFAIPIKTASGSGIKYGFIPDGIEFNIKKYNKREFIVVPDTTGCEFGGYDGIVGVI